MKNVVRYWLNKGFDGLRVDAVRYLVEEENAAIVEAKRLAKEEEERKRQELEERKNTPGYCHLCGAPDAEYIPFEEMYMCRDCYYDSKY